MTTYSVLTDFYIRGEKKLAKGETFTANKGEASIRMALSHKQIEKSEAVTVPVTEEAPKQSKGKSKKSKK